MKNKDCKSVTTDQCLRRQEEILEGRRARRQEGWLFKIVGRHSHADNEKRWSF